MYWFLRKNSIALLFQLICITSAAVRPITDVHFNATKDAINFHKSNAKQKLANEIFLFRSQKQRSLIQKEYRNLYHKELFPKSNDFRYTIFGDEYADLLYTMSRPITRQFFLDMIEDNKPNFASPNTLIDAMATFSNELWRNLREFRESKELLRHQPYFIDYLKNQWEHFGQMIDAIKQGRRNESKIVDIEFAKRDSEFLHAIFGKRHGDHDWMMDEHEMRNMFITRSFTHIRRMCMEYKALYHKNLLHDIENFEFADYHVKRAIIAIIQVRMDAPSYFAQRLFDALDGPGTNERDLNRIIITRSTVDMTEIKEAFQRKYQKSLASMIEDDTSGEYRNLLLAIIS